MAHRIHFEHQSGLCRIGDAATAQVTESNIRRHIADTCQLIKVCLAVCGSASNARLEHLLCSNQVLFRRCHACWGKCCI